MELKLENQGMRLIYGSVASDSVWLAVGDKGNANQKLFQFGDTLSIPVKIRGKHVQARNKVQQGKLTVDTNAGKVEVTVKMDVPVKAYPGGLFGGAKSPRQVAETVNANQKNKDKMKNETGKQLGFKEVEPQLKMRLIQEKRRDLYLEYAKGLKAKAKITIDDKALETAAASITQQPKELDLSNMKALPAPKQEGGK